MKSDLIFTLAELLHLPMQQTIRRRYPAILWVLVSLLGFAVGCTDIGQSNGIYFDDSSPEIMRLGNSYYEIGFRRSNGSIIHILDKTSGQVVSEGSRGQCLWGAVSRQTEIPYAGGCSYDQHGPNWFDYDWYPDDQILQFRYVPGSESLEKLPKADIIVSPSTGRWFEMQLNLDNRSEESIHSVHFPSDLEVAEEKIEELALPILPGVSLNSGFFDEDRSYITSYPGVFADFISLSTAESALTIYPVNGPDVVWPVRLGFRHDEEAGDDRGHLVHTYLVDIGRSTEWASPSVRIIVGESLNTSVDRFRIDSGIDSYPPLDEKLGEEYDSVVRSPVLKLEIRRAFTSYEGMLKELIQPAIIHLVSYWEYGFDENYPAFLPPDALYGTQADLANLVQKAQGLGLYVMPYTNPTWWDDESAVLQRKLASSYPEEFAVIDLDGEPVYECYTAHPRPPKCTPRQAARDSLFNRFHNQEQWLHGGYVVSPKSDFVRQELDDLVMGYFTEDIPTDLIFEDQIGARFVPYDYNSTSSRQNEYAMGWLEHFKNYAKNMLMTEYGADYLAGDEVGFHGSVLTAQREGNTDTWWGDSNWRPIPLAAMMMRDKVLLYQHNLDEETATHDLWMLMWNASFGYMLTFDLQWLETSPQEATLWLRLVHAWQQVFGRYANERILAFGSPAEDITETSFETVTVVSNWSKTRPARIDTHILPPHGFVVESLDGSFRAGVFVAYNDASLSEGSHHIIEERTAQTVKVQQPFGANTDIVLDLPVGLLDIAPLVSAYDEEDAKVAAVPSSVTGDQLVFRYEQIIFDIPVSYYLVEPGTG